MVELDSTLFKRLLKFYLFAFVISIFAVVFEFYVHPGWEFSDEFNALAADYFRPLISDDLWFAIVGPLFLAHLIGLIGLLRLRSWGRTLFVWPILTLTISDVAISSPPAAVTPLLTLITFVGTALFGAIVLMAYAPNLGGSWLKQRGISRRLSGPE